MFLLKCETITKFGCSFKVRRHKFIYQVIALNEAGVIKMKLMLCRTYFYYLIFRMVKNMNYFLIEVHKTENVC